MQLRKIFLFSIYFISAIAGAQLTPLGKPPLYNAVDLNPKYCSKVIDITSLVADDLAQLWQIPSNSVAIRKTFSDKNNIMCCVILDTPKGPYMGQVFRYYISQDQEIVADMNIPGFPKGDSMCQAIRSF